LVCPRHYRRGGIRQTTLHCLTASRPVAVAPLRQWGFVDTRTLA